MKTFSRMKPIVLDTNDNRNVHLLLSSDFSLTSRNSNVANVIYDLLSQIAPNTWRLILATTTA